MKNKSLSTKLEILFLNVNSIIEAGGWARIAAYKLEERG